MSPEETRPAGGAVGRFALRYWLAILLVGLAGAWVAWRRRLTDAWPQVAAIVSACVIYFYVDIRDHGDVYVGWRVGHVVFIALAPLVGLALLEAPENKIHHFAFEMRGWDDILHAADIFAMDDVPVDIGPTRHGITRGETIYFFDPSGNRNEVFSGGYIYYPDKPTITWWDVELGPAIFYHDRKLNEAFLSVFT